MTAAPRRGPRRPRPGVSHLREGVVDEVVEAALQPGEERLLLRLGQPAVGDRPVEVGLDVGVDRILEPGDRLALRDGDLRERLAGAKLLAQLCGRQAQVGGDGDRAGVARRASRALAAGRERAARTRCHGKGGAGGGERLLRSRVHAGPSLFEVTRIVPVTSESGLRKA